MTSCDFQRAASQRLGTSEFLFKNRFNLDAMHLAAYVIECSLKALILEVTPALDRLEQERRIRTNDLESLGSLLKNLKRPIPLTMVERIRKARWWTGLRYQSGRTDTGWTRGVLKTSRQVYDWVGGQLP